MMHSQKVNDSFARFSIEHLTSVSRPSPPPRPQFHHLAGACKTEDLDSREATNRLVSVTPGATQKARLTYFENDILHISYNKLNDKKATQCNNLNMRNSVGIPLDKVAVDIHAQAKHKTDIKSEKDRYILKREDNSGLLNSTYDKEDCTELSTSIEENHSENDETEGDSSDKPTHSYIALISMAILSSPEKKLVLSDIYQYIMDNFPYYNNQERAWRNSIRHNLSLNECFIKSGRAENGKGNYWSIHSACIEDFAKGDYRRRHARRRARGSAYADINVSSLPFSYRYNIGYVPMTPSPVLGYPYPIPYLPPSSAAQLLRSVDANTLASIAAHQKASLDCLIKEDMKRSASANAANQNRLDVMASSTPFGLLPTTPPSPLAATSKPPPLLSPLPIRSVLSPQLPYSPYHFPFAFP